MFSWPNKSEHAGFGRNETSVELARKNLAGLHCKFFKPYQKQENFLCRKKNHHRPASVLKKKSVVAISRSMSAVEFSIQSLNEICMMSIRKCSIGVIR